MFPLLRQSGFFVHGSKEMVHSDLVASCYNWSLSVWFGGRHIRLHYHTPLAFPSQCKMVVFTYIQLVTWRLTVVGEISPLKRVGSPALFGHLWCLKDWQWVDRLFVGTCYWILTKSFEEQKHGGLISKSVVPTSPMQLSTNMHVVFEPTKPELLLQA